MSSGGTLKTGRSDHRLILLLLCAAVVCLALLNLSIGQEWINPVEALRMLFAEPDSITAVIVREIRLPRTLIAVVAGISLGVSGAAMQGLLQNPLASPGLVGSASGAALGAVSVLYFSGPAWHPQAVPLAGMIGALVATGLVYLLAGRDSTVSTLILAGVAINALATAALSLLLNLAPSPFAVSELVLWSLATCPIAACRICGSCCPARWQAGCCWWAPDAHWTH